MRILVTFLYFSYALQVISAQNWLQGLFEQTGACFPTVESAGCTVPLWRNFTSKYPVDGHIEPTTLVYLFTPKSPEVAEPIHLCGGRLADDSTFDANANTEIFVHGYLDGVCRTAWMRECKEQLYERAKITGESFNVILVDWSWGDGPAYLPATRNLRIVGEQLGFIINNIMIQKSVGPEKFHLVGHSLGAHILGYASRTLRKFTSRSNLIRRITALDPALPEFLSTPPSQRVTYRDAHIVDVIHTGSGLIPYVYLGDSRHLGHADFYPNGGDIQPGCYTYLIEAILKGDFVIAVESLLPNACTHLQSLQFYKLSINSQGCQYVGITSRSYAGFLNHSTETASEWAVMGMDFEKYYKNDGRRKRYFLTTSISCPYYDDSYLGNYALPFNTTCQTDALPLL